MRIRFGELLFTCSFAVCENCKIVFKTSDSPSNFFETHYNHKSEARHALKILRNTGSLMVSNLKEVDRFCFNLPNEVEKQNCGEFILEEVNGNCM